MQKYGLKIISEFDLKDKIQIVAVGDVEIKEDGVFEIICNADINIRHTINSGLSHIYAISNADNINIKIESSVEANQNVDVYHEIKAKNKNIKSEINMHAVLFDNAKLIYRSNLAADAGSEGVGNQKAKVLYVGDGSEADIIPNLDIQSDKFKTSHAISISTFEDREKFYLSLHGLDNTSAEEFIIDSFLKKYV